MILVGVLALAPFAVLGDLVGASDRATLFLRAGTGIITVLAVLFWRAMYGTYGPDAARVGILGAAFAGFVATTLISRMASFPDAVFGLPFLFPVWLALLLFAGSALTDRRGMPKG